MILFLAAYMKKGYGVSVVVHSLCKEYLKLGVKCVVACLESDGFFLDIDVVETTPDPSRIKEIASGLGCKVIVAHTTPFFEVLPGLADRYATWCWEHGDPNPEFFTQDRLERRLIIQRKRNSIYENVTGVIAISNFIRREIDFPKAKVIHNGCDHIESRPKSISHNAQVVRVGTLVRLGTGEAIYKGRPLLVQLYKNLLSKDLPIELHVMGRGTEQDRVIFESMGVKVHLNASDEERLEYLENLDVFVSTSLWEGFNLPLVEAQASGTVGLAFDVGAHPEVTPIVVRNLYDMMSLIEHYFRNQDDLKGHSEMCRHWVLKKFRWKKAAKSSLELFMESR